MDPFDRAISKSLGPFIRISQYPRSKSGILCSVEESAKWICGHG